MLYVVATAG